MSASLRKGSARASRYANLPVSMAWMTAGVATGRPGKPFSSFCFGNELVLRRRRLPGGGLRVGGRAPRGGPRGPHLHRTGASGAVGLGPGGSQAGKASTQVKGLTADDLRLIVGHFNAPDTPPPSPATLRDLALVQVMRDGLLRRGEAAELVWGDISRAFDGSGRLVIRHSKTDQEGKGAIVYLREATMAALDRIRPPTCRRRFRCSGSADPTYPSE